MNRLYDTAVGNRNTNVTMENCWNTHFKEILNNNQYNIFASDSVGPNANEQNIVEQNEQNIVEQNNNEENIVERTPMERILTSKALNRTSMKRIMENATNENTTNENAMNDINELNANEQNTINGTDKTDEPNNEPNDTTNTDDVVKPNQNPNSNSNKNLEVGKIDANKTRKPLMEIQNRNGNIKKGNIVYNKRTKLKTDEPVNGKRRQSE